MVGQYIYVLKCPSTSAVRYVGKGTDLKSRLRQHISEARLRKIKSHKCDWIRSILKLNLWPVMEIDVVVHGEQCWKEIEQQRISHYRSLGCDLTNSTDGGDAPENLTEQGRRVLSERASAQFGTPEGREKQSVLMKELCKDPEWVARRAAAAKATRSSQEYRAKRSIVSKALWADHKHRAHMAEVRRKLNADPEFRKKISIGLKRAQSDPAVKVAKALRTKASLGNPAIRERQIEALRINGAKRREANAALRLAAVALISV